MLLQDLLASSDPTLIARLADDFGSVYRDRMFCRSRLYAGVADLLDRLAELKVPLAVLSNKPDEFTVPMCETLLDRWPVVRCQGARTENERKPNPGCAIELAREMKRRAADVRFVGDSTIDILTAHNAGMKSVAVSWGYRDKNELEAAGPAWLIDQPAELLGLLDGNA